MGLFDEIFLELLLYQAEPSPMGLQVTHETGALSSGASSLLRDTELKQGTAEEITSAFNVIV